MRPSVKSTKENHKPCVICLVDKPLTDFHKTANRADKRRAYCKKCDHHTYWLRQNQLTQEHYNSIIIGQSGLCLVCGEPLTGKICIDHDHSCCSGRYSKCGGGCVRGILHDGCNVLLGLAKDNPQILYGAARYLEQWTDRPHTL